jgi:hypothetical protein
MDRSCDKTKRSSHMSWPHDPRDAAGVAGPNTHAHAPHQSPSLSGLASGPRHTSAAPPAPRSLASPPTSSNIGSPIVSRERTTIPKCEIEHQRAGPCPARGEPSSTARSTSAALLQARPWISASCSTVRPHRLPGVTPLLSSSAATAPRGSSIWNSNSRAAGGEASRRPSLPYLRQPVGSRWRSNLGRNGISPVGIGVEEARGDAHRIGHASGNRGRSGRWPELAVGAILTELAVAITGVQWGIWMKEKITVRERGIVPWVLYLPNNANLLPNNTHLLPIMPICLCLPNNTN